MYIVWAMEEKPAKLVIVYATQTGNALDAAERIGREAERRGCPATLRSVDDFDAASLPQEDTVIFVVSTTGQGDLPDSMKAFWKFLLQKNLTKHWLQGVSYAVFGLGDSGYQKYNFVAKKLDRRLSDLGATAIVERGLGDDQHPSGYEGSLDPWMSSLWHALYQANPKFFPNGPDFMIPDEKLIDRPKVQIRYHGTEKQDFQFRKSSDANWEGPLHVSCKIFSQHEYAPINQYEVGDVLEVLPGQNPEAVDAFIQRCNLDPDSLITVHPIEMESHLHSQSNASKVPIKLKKFVELTMDVASASPRRYFFEARILYVMSFFATAQHERERLQYFASPEGRDDLYQYNQKERRTVLEVLEDFPSVQLPFEWLVQLVPPLKTRAFSISSSPLAHTKQVHLTVNVVSWRTPFKRKRTGLCSTWLAGLEPQKSVYIPAWFHKGSLPSPKPSLPLILIGPGTGCAPFRGFLEERAIQDVSGSAAPVMFFFGCRNEENDFLYKELWSSHAQEGGLLSEARGGGFYVAFSRDQPQKVYVQHKLREHSHSVWKLLLEGASVYVAGSSTKMPSDVMAAFEEIISKETGVSKEAAAMQLRRLEREGRYHVEAWS
ncbi:multidrug-resistance type transporter [Turnera subulata]|uniref:NADPH-dependent diflavin oxidoreductase 1 n=1 Tax=Turnera subulata TaxID=218843 RepID=A0A9Q0JHN8_9ROSI|nr:multidrug-resistance type transporter [Turnera subulata]